MPVSKIPILSSLSLGRVGVCVWDDFPKGHQKNVFIVFFSAPPNWKKIEADRRKSLPSSEGRLSL